MSEIVIDVFVRRELSEARKTNPLLNSLITDFSAYKKGYIPAYFGKDVPYHDPKPYAERAKIRHIHILGHVRSVRLGKTSDSALVYTEASMKLNTYYIIDFVESGAHQKAREPAYMNWIIDMAESFRMKN